MDEFAYFMIRIRRKAGKGAGAEPLTGVIERLGSGEKSEFEGASELVQLMAHWTANTSAISETGKGAGE